MFRIGAAAFTVIVAGSRRPTHGQADADVVDAHEGGGGPGAGVGAKGL